MDDLFAFIGIVLGPVALIASGAAIAAVAVLIVANLFFKLVDRG